MHCDLSPIFCCVYFPLPVWSGNDVGLAGVRREKKTRVALDFWGCERTQQERDMGIPKGKKRAMDSDCDIDYREGLAIAFC